MFGEQPYATVQMAELAREAGVARGLLNHYFGTKRDLYVEVVRAMMIVPEIDTVTLPGGTLRERVEASVDWLMTVLDTHGKTWLAVGVEGIGDDPQIAAILDDADDRAAAVTLGRGDQFLRARDGDIDAPFVHAKIHRPDRAYAIDEQHGGMPGGMPGMGGGMPGMGGLSALGQPLSALSGLASPAGQTITRAAASGRST